jgi:antitoxin HigA-1
MRDLNPITPGELLREEFLVPMGISQYRLAREAGVPPQRISEIVAGKRAITADTDLRLCRFLELSNGYWLRAPGRPRHRGCRRGPCRRFGPHQALEWRSPGRRSHSVTEPIGWSSPSFHSTRETGFATPSRTFGGSQETRRV